MKLYLMRHGIAEESNPGGDTERRLTPIGKASLKQAGRALQRLNIGFDRMIASPYVRASQTASIIAGETGFSDETFTDSRLIPSGRFENVSNLIYEHREAGSLLLVGHQPLIGQVISGLVAQHRLTVRVSPGSIAAIEVIGFRPHTNGALLWTIPAEMLADAVC